MLTTCVLRSRQLPSNTCDRATAKAQRRSSASFGEVQTNCRRTIRNAKLRSHVWQPNGKWRAKRNNSGLPSTKIRQCAVKLSIIFAGFIVAETTPPSCTKYSNGFMRFLLTKLRLQLISRDWDSILSKTSNTQINWPKRRMIARLTKSTAPLPTLFLCIALEETQRLLE